MTDVPGTWFVSYARADAAFALRIADALIAAGIPLWVDQYNISPSQHWDRSVEMAVRGCSGLLVILSPRSCASHNVADEIAVGLESGKAIVPVMMETCVVPLRLTRVQYIDARTDINCAISACVKALSKPSAFASRPSPETVTVADLTPAPFENDAFPPEVMTRITRALTRQLGPIAPSLIKRERNHASTPETLCEALAERIASATDRANFLAEALTANNGRP
jgi:hypothetical protein